jgi:hypothetical protein
MKDPRNEIEGTHTEWRVTGDPGPDWKEYDFVWSPWRNPHLGDPEKQARWFHASTIEHERMNNVRLMRRTVTVGPWEEVENDGEPARLPERPA